MQWLALGGLVLASWLSLPLRMNAEAENDSPAFTALLADLAVQQTTAADNQAKIDEKLAALAVDIRLTRIYAGRGGGKTLGK